MLNVSDLREYEYCKRKLYLKNVLGLDEPVTPAMVQGRVTHTALDHVSRADERIVTHVDPDDIFGTYTTAHAGLVKQAVVLNKDDLETHDIELTDAFNAAWNAVLPETTERARLVQDTWRATGLTGAALWEALTPKIRSEAWLASEEIGLQGKADKVKEYDDESVVYEYKKSTAPDNGVWPSDKIQINAYLALLDDKDHTVNKGIVRYDTEERRVRYNPFVRGNVIDYVKDVKDTLARAELPDRVENTNKCMSCALQDQCYDDEYMQEQMMKRFG
jgi:CRISPR-associated protein Cas4